MAANPEAKQPPVNPGRIIELSTAYWGSQVLLTANRIELFDTLAGGGKDAASVADELGLDKRMTELFLNACVGLGLCEKHGDT
ncbi:MAG: hypothetical protein KJO82_01315, partial [Gammaproteobacteria bacterium]|nr:hypothetical protein [Gammaproteobacteria bacterium]